MTKSIFVVYTGPGLLVGRAVTLDAAKRIQLTAKLQAPLAASWIEEHKGKKFVQEYE
jgi:hypothetical protein